MRLVAIAEKIASPSAPPTCWEEFMIEATSPAWLVLGARVRGGGDADEHGPDPEREEHQPGQDVREVAAIHRHSREQQ